MLNLTPPTHFSFKKIVTTFGMLTAAAAALVAELHVVVQLHLAASCSDIIGQLHHYRHYRFWML